ncbi:flagellar biosynthetic protein FliO [Polymorphobacter fuscus]|uniref:Flagellar biosynthetic protein FliO n=1 Tax=Sandarakinorhabdus fusca TaxID=1439888 RepID=A0A7C9LEE1_9SPHN|nr:flagellar biosynthetic protein FliO [Polymorphobacter fuscus]KAB7648334.1 flagellar biosynthetic protein FliO [Polymorphobacter fuscus]MQT15847.1 hypothetical protein [Polymorphobacter fuscus]NJC07880.1 hypothetical protein [Polymorphobacter fuscus]
MTALVADWRAKVAGALKWPRDSGPARVVQALPLGPGSRLLVVEFGGRQLLIGQARTGLVRLGETEMQL